ncbi:MAG: type I pullulanase [Lachnospiraceae bacterium]|nr:type I pullulanase [Lachnospiraceae bacterium]
MWKKRQIAGFLALLMVFMTVVSVFTPGMTAKAAGTTLIVHYGGRADDSYDGWNLWIWEEGREGQQVDFTDEDDFGKVAVYQTNRKPASIGFIVRLNQWEDKDMGDDRYVTMDGETVEIWVTSGEAEFATEAPAGAAEYDIAALEEARLNIYNEDGATKLNVHYYNFDQKYNAGNMEVYAWAGNDVGGSYPMSETDDFGAFFKVGLLPKDGVTTAGVRVIQDGNVDAALDYEIDLTTASNDAIDVYIVEGNPILWYTMEEVIYNPVIAEAYFSESSSKEISATLSRAPKSMSSLATQLKVTDGDGVEYAVASADSEDGRTILLTMEEELELSKTYDISMDGYEGTTVSMNKIIGSSYFDDALTYDGDDLGAAYTKEKTGFKVWAPTASEVSLNLYEQGDGDNLIETISMTLGDKGVWSCEKQGDLNGVYYTYSIKIGNKTNEAVDLYARTTGVNGNRGMVVDLSATNPEGFENDTRPAFVNPTDAVIYELHVRDLSSDESSGISNTGKFLGLTERGTTNADGLATGIDHIKDLGVTHVQILPSYDYATVDETKLDTPQFNWGYDPKNYNVPEGSYSTDPYHGEVRINEMKQMIQALHENGIRVNMDVVYNHTFNIEDSNFQKTVPDYYYRKVGESFSNASGCGNETASDHAMMRKYIVDSVVYWATEYHIDGFRFDLMAVHDIETMNAVRAALDEVDPSIMVYGEGWTAGDAAIPSSQQALKANMSKIDRVGAFSDDIRDAIKGSVFDAQDKGFISGKDGMEESIKFSIVAATPHQQVLTSKNDKGSRSWAEQPGQSINYISCHDNLTFWDKLAISNADDSEETRIKMNKLGSAIILTSQGVPFFQAGEEMLRSKPSATVEGGFDENSYTSPDSTNSIKWSNKANVMDTYEYYKGLIAFRKAHSALRMTTKADIQSNLVFMSGLDPNVVGYTIANNANGDTAEKITVIFNGNENAVDVALPAGTWEICVNDKAAGTASVGTAEGTVSVAGISAMVLVQGDNTIVKAETKTDNETDTSVSSESTENTETAEKSSGNTPLIAGGIIVALAAVVAGVLIKKRKK